MLAAGCGGPPGGFRVLARFASPVTSVVSDGDAVWVGTNADGLQRVPLAGGAATAFGAAAGLDGNRGQVRWVAPARAGLLLATAGGVALFAPGTGRVTRTWTAKDGLAADNVRWAGEVQGALWAGTTAGASRLTPGAARWQSFTVGQGLSQNHVYRMADDGRDLWASCIMGGLARFDARASRFVPVPQERGLGNRYLYAMDPHPGLLWLGSAAGVNLYDTAKRAWVERETADGFTDYAVRAVLVDGDDLWFGTAYGLYHRSLARGAQEHWTRANGLPDDEVTALAKAGGGTVIVGTKTAVSAIRVKGKT